ncbi:TPA: hypothetical protein L3645_006315 [Pseudomonas aeruginosa]|nr:hypothetical protein [Pseudomonas aeruginosa]
MNEIERESWRDTSLRAAGLILIGLGALIAGLQLGSFIVPSGDVSPGLAIALGIGMATTGVLRGGLSGLLFFATGNVILGLSGGLLIASALPGWLTAIALGMFIVGFALRIFNLD